MPTPVFTRAQYEAALEALGLDPATTVSANLAPDWARVVHTDRDVTQGPIDDEEEGGDVD